MTIQDLKNKINEYNFGETRRSWVVGDNSILYSNDYINVIRFDSSNRWIDNDKMSKMWSIIFDKKKDFTHLKQYQVFQNSFNVKITPVTRGKIRGYFGIRIYDMKQEPNSDIIKIILDFIFN